MYGKVVLFFRFTPSGTIYFLYHTHTHIENIAKPVNFQNLGWLIVYLQSFDKILIFFNIVSYENLQGCIKVKVFCIIMSFSPCFFNYYASLVNSVSFFRFWFTFRNFAPSLYNLQIRWKQTNGTLNCCQKKPVLILNSWIFWAVFCPKKVLQFFSILLQNVSKIWVAIRSQKSWPYLLYRFEIVFEDLIDNY